MNARVPLHSPPQPIATTTVFTSGNSQAVRLPKEFRFSTKQVTIEKRGDEIVLRERKPTLGELLEGLPVLTPHEARDWDQLLAQARHHPAQERNWADLLGTEKSAAKKADATKKQVTPRRAAASK